MSEDIYNISFPRGILIFSEGTPTYSLKEQRKVLKEWAKANIVGKTIEVPSICKHITITVSGIKEALNQPHKHYFEKNEAIKDIENQLATSTFVETKIDSTGDCNNMFHYLRTSIKGEDSFIVLRETKKDGMIIFYSIVDKIKSD